MKLRKPCEHGRYDSHFVGDGLGLPIYGYSDDTPLQCLGGAFLPDDVPNNAEQPTCQHVASADSWLEENFSCELPEGHEAPHRATPKLEWWDGETP